MPTTGLTGGDRHDRQPSADESPRTAQHTYTSDQVCSIAGVTLRQLDYWNRQLGLLAPVWVDAHGEATQERGSGLRRRWPVVEVVKICALASMLADGITLEVAVGLIRQDRFATLHTRLLPVLGDLPIPPAPDGRKRRKRIRQKVLTDHERQQLKRFLRSGNSSPP